jgi:hypothetical protein
MNLAIAWLAQGKVRIKAGDALPRTVESRFGQGIRERALRSQQRHAWKTQGEGDKFLAGAMLWGRAAKDPAAVPITITSLCRGAGRGELLYSLETDELCAVLALDNLGEEERRLWNKNDKRLSHLAVSATGAVACSVRHQFGTANIAVRPDADSGFSDVTEGDSFDAAPRWVPGEGQRLVFQSAGVGRDRHGQFAGLGPFSIQRLDVEKGELTTLVQEPGSDLLTPQISPAGDLYFLRRPYEPGRGARPLRLLKDIVLFPFRLVYAFFQWLQFFSIRYTGKTLTSPDGSRGREMDLKQMLIWGNTVNASRSSPTSGDAPDLVPNSWQLVRRTPGGVEKVLAKGVLAYDLAPDGSVLYSNGSAIFLMDAQGNIERVAVESMIEQVALLGPVGP